MIDTAIIKVRAGNGGDGKVSFRREKYIPFGGPDGGDGGRGGSVFFVADNNLATLMDFRGKTKIEGNDGQMGGKKKMSGLSADDIFIKVPVGTLVYERKEGKEYLIADLSTNGQTELIAKGGKGGKGNDRFKSSVNRTPLQYTKGVKGQSRELRLEIKLVADVGLIGYPNAGKSTLINSLAGTSAKIGNYAFTTLSPNLGVCMLKNGKSIVLADIPGLIEGASEGKGLGFDFLRHVERTRVLIHIVDPFTEDIEKIPETALNNYKVLRSELKNYGEHMLEKREVIAINKLDITEVRERFEKIKKLFKKEKLDVLGISAYTGEGLEDVLIALTKIFEEIGDYDMTFEIEKPAKVFDITNLPNKKMVFGTVEDLTGKPDLYQDQKEV